MGRRLDIKPLPSLERLRELLSYDPETGVLIWRHQKGDSKSISGFNSRCAGMVAGTFSKRGYLVIGIRKYGATKGTYYLAHRIIWKLMTGVDPEDQIDHEDNNRINNKWVNLRPARNGPNIQNSKLRRDNKSGVKGVSWDGFHKKWVAQISADGKQWRLGRFTTLQQAAEVVSKERVKLHGEFARLA